MFKARLYNVGGKQTSS